MGVLSYGALVVRYNVRLIMELAVNAALGISKSLRVSSVAACPPCRLSAGTCAIVGERAIELPQAIIGIAQGI